MLTNQSNVVSVAAERREPEGQQSQHGQTLAEAIATIARMLTLSAPKASDSDKQFLRDLMRGEGRYPMRALERLTEIAQLSRRPEHREALARLIRERSTPKSGAVPSVAGAFDVETERQGEADVLQRLYERCPTPINRERVIAALHAEEIAAREAIEAVRLAVVQG